MGGAEFNDLFLLIEWLERKFCHVYFILLLEFKITSLACKGNILFPYRGSCKNRIGEVDCVSMNAV